MVAGMRGGYISMVGMVVADMVVVAVMVVAVMVGAAMVGVAMVGVAMVGAAMVGSHGNCAMVPVWCGWQGCRIYGSLRQEGNPHQATLYYI